MKLLSCRYTDSERNSRNSNFRTGISIARIAITFLSHSHCKQMKSSGTMDTFSIALEGAKTNIHSGAFS